MQLAKVGACSIVDGSSAHTSLTRAARAVGARCMLGKAARRALVEGSSARTCRGQLSAHSLCKGSASCWGSVHAREGSSVYAQGYRDVYAQSGMSPTQWKHYPQARTAAGSQVKQGRLTAAATRGDGGSERKSWNMEIPSSTWESVVLHGPWHMHGTGTARARPPWLTGV
ncbi:hypothetical protein DFH09DRAFT_1073646 [Mycena vulgaris]|nr:hypothetical protein DFH09DRAFT_1073646 [Mycena vulgaris]